MVLTRVRFVTARTFPELESAVNAALAELDQHPDVQAIARIAFQPSVTGRNRCVRMRLSPPCASRTMARIRPVGRGNTFPRAGLPWLCAPRSHHGSSRRQGAV